MKTGIRSEPGLPQPKGAIFLQGGINFALFSRHATSVSLVIIPQDDLGNDKQSIELVLDPRLNKTGDIWHVLVSNLPEHFTYGYRLDGPFDPKGEGHYYNNKLVMIDPYARMMSASTWGEDRGDLGGKPCCMVPEAGYDWEGDRPLCTPLKDSVIYELHVRGYTIHSSSGVPHPGTFAGIVDKIPYLQDLGITAVELMPITEFNENETVFKNPFTGENLKNFWGYSPLSFFAPKGGYCCLEGNQVNEFRDMVSGALFIGLALKLSLTLFLIILVKGARTARLPVFEALIILFTTCWTLKPGNILIFQVAVIPLTVIIQ